MRDKLKYLNTSYVKVQFKKGSISQADYEDLNTSYVKVQSYFGKSN